MQNPLSSPNDFLIKPNHLLFNVIYDDVSDAYVYDGDFYDNGDVDDACFYNDDKHRDDNKRLNDSPCLFLEKL